MAAPTGVFTGMSHSFNEAVKANAGATPSIPKAKPAIKPNIQPATPPAAPAPAPNQDNSFLGGMFGNMRSPEGFASVVGALKPITEPIIQAGGLPLFMQAYDKMTGNNNWASLTEGRKLAGYSRFIRP